MSVGDIIEVEPLDKDDNIIKDFEKVFYSNTSAYTHVFFSKSAIMMVPKIKSDELQYPSTMSEIFDKTENPTFFQKKEISKIKLKKSKMMTMVTIELKPGTELYGKQRRQGATLSFLKRDFDNVYFVLNNYFRDKLVIISSTGIA